MKVKGVVSIGESGKLINILSRVSRGGSMRVKTSLLLDEALWRLFKARVVRERGVRGLSEAVEEAIREELCELEVAEALARLAGEEMPALDVEPVKPLVETSAGRAVKELREPRV